MAENLRIAVVGTGDMGGAIATALAERTGHDVLVRGSRSGSASERALVDGSHGRIAAWTDDDADVVFLVVPWEALEPAARALAAFRGVLVSVVVPYADGGDPRSDNVSAAERIAAFVPHAQVVNAFTSIGSDVVRDPGTRERATLFVCTDHDDAARLVAVIGEELGFAPLRAGGLQNARYAEGLGHLWAALAYDAGLGERVTYRVIVA